MCLSGTWYLEQFDNLPIARFQSKLTKWPSFCIACPTNTRKPLNESLYPRDIALANSKSKVIKISGQVTTQLTKILDCPTCWCSTEPTVDAIDCCSSLNQKLYYLTVSVERCVMKKGSTRFVSFVDEVPICIKHGTDRFNIPAIDCLEQLGGATHSTPHLV